jgi:hypothetical protein
MWTYARKWQNGIYGPIRDGDGDVAQSILCSVFELMVEKLKKRIEAANGPVMDKVADALTESMDKEFEAMKQKSSAKKELHEKLAKIFSEGSQKQK